MNSIRTLKTDTSGVAMLEMALSLPLLMLMSLGGLEMANFMATRMRVDAVAVQLADNMARLGEGEANTVRTVEESAVDDAFEGAQLQANSLDMGNSGSFTTAGSRTALNPAAPNLRQQMDINTAANWTGPRARIVVSNVVNDTANSTPGNPRYRISWQKCWGAPNSQFPSAINPATTQVGGDYGTFNTSTGRNMTGIGPTGRQAFPAPDTQIVYVQVLYVYRPLFISGWSIVPETLIESTSSAVVRDDRTDTVLPAGNPVQNTCD